MKEANDKLCDDILTLLKDSEDIVDVYVRTGSYRDEATTDNDLFSMLNIPEKEGTIALRFLESLKYIYIYPTKRKIEGNKEVGIYELTLLLDGYNFISSCSFVEITFKENLKEKIELKNLESTELAIQLNKYLIKTKWLPHVFATLSLIASIIALYQSCKKQ